MRKHSMGVILFTVILVLSAGCIIAQLVWNNYRQHVIDNNRRALMCETLKSGMSISKVSVILKSMGNVIIEEDTGSTNIARYSVLFTEKKEQDSYGGWFELDFVNGKYNGASEPVFDHYEEICHFGLTS